MSNKNPAQFTALIYPNAWGLTRHEDHLPKFIGLMSNRIHVEIISVHDANPDDFPNLAATYEASGLYYPKTALTVEFTCRTVEPCQTIRSELLYGEMYEFSTDFSQFIRIRRLTIDDCVKKAAAYIDDKITLSPEQRFLMLFPWAFSGNPINIEDLADVNVFNDSIARTYRNHDRVLAPRIKDGSIEKAIETHALDVIELEGVRGIFALVQYQCQPDAKADPKYLEFYIDTDLWHLFDVDEYGIYRNPNTDWLADESSDIFISISNFLSDKYISTNNWNTEQYIRCLWLKHHIDELLDDAIAASPVMINIEPGTNEEGEKSDDPESHFEDPADCREENLD